MRLHDPRPMTPTVTISFEGAAVPARRGETVAAALTASGRLARRTPSGPHCGMGARFGCLVTIDGRRPSSPA